MNFMKVQNKQNEIFIKLKSYKAVKTTWQTLLIGFVIIRIKGALKDLKLITFNMV